ncbi:type VII secretion integral membrane protein EccD [Nocardia farcinica]|uniref:type VII secretion integral membrane protein EccD n=1 Tax=Nocardia farcinica TaxID=37329 RepID=UPI000760DFB7|nr:type VII secretion integral membrane protein EccD [Nocardia farcinica]AXK86379.1 type VII secretion integral membrane protein EccD [Nocardia farcinica]MBA4857715.1 type VII secretion integral membrane protein EccD [Nocardia farcinica]MBC9817409.1 type VII secretion integral membrane protein EccD [Nocardia farcinica]MBF6263002.1 type VII secretion integral membrane protein EccD [Nocardia farcinica]MBF6281506.1 type VII secretion integral membrane protein EccD [Nocardia farcinica]
MTHARLDHIDEDSSRGIVRAPDLARVTILAKHTQVDMAIPVDVPVALVIPSVVDMVAQHSRSNDFDNEGERFEPAEWVLARIGHPPFSNSLSLGEHGVRDGELLMLESASHTAPTPLFDDIMYNVAIADADHFRGWTPKTARLTGSVLAAVTMLVGCLGLLASPAAMPEWVSGSIALAVVILLVVAGMVLSRMYGDTATALVLGGCALPAAFTAGMLYVPDHYGWAHLLLGGTLLGATAILAWRVTGVGLALFIGTAAVAVYLAPAALVGLLTDQPLRAIGAVAAALGLAGLSLAPRLSMLLAKLPLPPVPSPGTPIDPTEDDPDDHRALPTMEALRVKSERARMYLAGLVAATTLVTAAGALAATDPQADDPYWQGIALALVCAVVLMFRSRTYAGAEQAVVLIAGGAAIVLIMLVGAAFTMEIPLAVFGATMLMLVAALILGIIIPNQSATPPMRRGVELLEYAFVAAVLPLVFWVTSLYSLVRGL